MVVCPVLLTKPLCRLMGSLWLPLLDSSSIVSRRGATQGTGTGQRLTHSRVT